MEIIGGKLVYEILFSSLAVEHCKLANIFHNYFPSIPYGLCGRKDKGSIFTI